jgi:hypothetical protein
LRDKPVRIKEEKARPQRPGFDFRNGMELGDAVDGSNGIGRRPVHDR